MDLDDATAGELAAFFAKRFPAAADRARLAARAGVDFTEAGSDATTAWRGLVSAAARRGALGRLAEAAESEAPGDANLVAVRRILAGRSRSWVIPAFSAAAVVMVVAGVAMWMLRPEAAPAPAMVAPAPAAPPAAPPAPPAPPEPVATPAAAPEPVVAPPDRASRPAKSRARSGCSAPEGELIGYWYAGRTKPGEQGALATLSGGARVREDYPHAANGHRVDAPIRCTLPGGTQVRLSQAPIATSGHWWVPFSGGDLQP